MHDGNLFVFILSRSLTKMAVLATSNGLMHPVVLELIVFYSSSKFRLILYVILLN
jgi:hypothetical protein